jgi:hypothetical protein
LFARSSSFGFGGEDVKLGMLLFKAPLLCAELFSKLLLGSSLLF